MLVVAVKEIDFGEELFEGCLLREGEPAVGAVPGHLNSKRIIDVVPVIKGEVLLEAFPDLFCMGEGLGGEEKEKIINPYNEV